MTRQGRRRRDRQTLLSAKSASFSAPERVSQTVVKRTPDRARRIFAHLGKYRYGVAGVLRSLPSRRRKKTHDVNDRKRNAERKSERFGKSPLCLCLRRPSDVKIRIFHAITPGKAYDAARKKRPSRVFFYAAQRYSFLRNERYPHFVRAIYLPARYALCA